MTETSHIVGAMKSCLRKMTDRMSHAGSRRLSAAGIFAAMLVLMIGVTSCGTVKRSYMEKMRSIRIHDFNVESFKMSGLRSADLTFSATVYNPSIKLKLKDISVSIAYNGKVLAYASPEPLTLARRSESAVRTVTKIELAPSASILDLASLAAGSFNEDNITVRVTATGVGANIIVKKIDESFSLSELKAIASGHTK